MSNVRVSQFFSPDPDKTKMTGTVVRKFVFSYEDRWGKVPTHGIHGELAKVLGIEYEVHASILGTEIVVSEYLDRLISLYFTSRDRFDGMELHEFLKKVLVVEENP